MSLKKKLGSKLAHGVREVQSQRTPVATTKTVVAAKPSAPRANQETVKKAVHPKRVWPD
jgi:hypothetical protein